jgi:hypothetical protein
MPRAYDSGGQGARGSPARMPGGLPLPNRLYEISAKCRFRFHADARLRIWSGFEVNTRAHPASCAWDNKMKNLDHP